MILHCNDHIMSNAGANEIMIQAAIGSRYFALSYTGASRELCECDQAMASCVANSASTYDVHKLNDHSHCKGYESSSHPGLTQMIASCKALFNAIRRPKITYG